MYAIDQNLALFLIPIFVYIKNFCNSLLVTYKLVTQNNFVIEFIHDPCIYNDFQLLEMGNPKKII